MVFTVYLSACSNLALTCSVFDLSTKMNNLLSNIFKAKIGHNAGEIRLFPDLIITRDCISAVYRHEDLTAAAA